MKTGTLILAPGMLLAGVGIGSLLHWPVVAKKTIFLQFDPLGDLIVPAKAGDQIKWFNGSAPAGVQFYGLHPCANGSDPSKGTCTLKESGLYKFSCDQMGCPDPAIGAGDDIKGDYVTKFATHLDQPYANPPRMMVQCDASSNVTLTPPIVTAAKGMTDALGQAFMAQIYGPASLTFTADTKFPTGICAPGDDLSGTSTSCRVKATATSGSYNYAIKLIGCTNSTTATLIVP